MRKEYEQQIENALTNILNRLNTIHDRSVEYVPGYKLYPPQIHTIELIGVKGDMRVSDVATNLGLSKSAVSRQVTQLDKLGYVEKYKNGTNNKEVYLRLTEPGWLAFHGHEQFHSRKRYACYEKSDTYSPREQALILEFLQLYSTSLDDFYERLDGNKITPKE